MAPSHAMIMHYTSLLLLFILPHSALCLEYHTILPRTTSSLSDGQSPPAPTKAPVQKRAAHVPSNICGWYSGSGYDDTWHYYDTQSTCFWHSDYKIIGAPADLFPVITTCVDYGQSAPDDSSTIQCSSTAPYCLTVRYDSDYYGWFCTDTPGVTWQMEPTWSGFQTPILFPIYTGFEGISTGTQYPPGYPSASETDSQSTSTIDTNTDSTAASSTGGSGEDQSTASASSSSTTSTSSSSSSVPVGGIVGGVIGGLAVIGIFCFAIMFMIMRSRRSRNNSSQDTAGNAQQPSMGSYSQTPSAQSPDMAKAPLSDQNSHGGHVLEMDGAGQPFKPSELPHSPPAQSAPGYAVEHPAWPAAGHHMEIDSRQVTELDGSRYVYRA